jgi:hypothetical protein
MNKYATNKKEFLLLLEAIPADLALGDKEAIRYQADSVMDHCPLTIVGGTKDLSQWYQAGYKLGLLSFEVGEIAEAADSPPRWYHMPWGFKRKMWRIYRKHQRKAGWV